ncbi:hypothetical protein [Streptomyces sp. DSM 40907]|uniref:hypothetical protein n=1 Tax=Streptomyces kutzneri TaxID=3051179 RepID=UPI0028D5341B|nr:hypothetical protein [Streptomyces sp. DSM 40907]
MTPTAAEGDPREQRNTGEGTFVNGDVLGGVNNYYGNFGPPPPPHGDGRPMESRGRWMHFFKAGCGVGWKLTMIPLSDAPESAEKLADFLDTLRLIGFGEDKIQPFHEISRNLPIAESSEAGRALVYDYADAMVNVIDEARRQSSSGEFNWFTLGRLLHSIAYVATVTWPDEVGEELSGMRKELLFLSDLLEVPRGFRAALKNYSRMALPTVGQGDVLNQADLLHQACITLLSHTQHGTAAED